MFWIEMPGGAGQEGKENRKKILMLLAAGICMGSVWILRRRWRRGREEQRESRQAEGHRKGIYERHVKRPMDMAFALLLILMLSPVLAVTALLVRMKLGAPVIFKQERPGYQEKIFILYKFRTMTDERDGNGELLPDRERLTKFGKALRSTSLDELPELFNILKGDMSFVGPRPLAVQYLPYYSSKERKRHSVRPGLTGLAQVHGRNAASWEERFSHDLEYISHITFLGDACIILKTAGLVLRRTNIGVRGIDSPMDLDVCRKKQREMAQGD